MSEIWGFKDQRDFNRAKDAIRSHEGGDDLGESSGARPNSGNQSIVGKLTSRDGTDKRKYAWEQHRGTNTSTEAISGGLTGTLTDRSAFDLSGGGFDLTNKI